MRSRSSGSRPSSVTRALPAALAAGVAQVNVHIDQARADQQPGGVDPAAGIRTAGADGGDPPAGEGQVVHTIDALGRIEDPAAGNDRHVA